MNKIILLFVFNSLFSFSQTTTIVNLNKILAHFQNSYEGVTKYGVKTSCMQKNFKFKLNAEKTKLIYSWDAINTSTNKKVESFSYEITISVIDFDKIDLIVGKDNSCLIVINQIPSSSKKFICRCNGIYCDNSVEYTDYFTIEFSHENCVKYHEEFLDLFKMLKS